MKEVLTNQVIIMQTLHALSEDEDMRRKLRERIRFTEARIRGLE